MTGRLIVFGGLTQKTVGQGVFTGVMALGRASGYRPVSEFLPAAQMSKDPFVMECKGEWKK
jgi:hypothetical protein